MFFAYSALLGRILLIGFERIFIKKLKEYDSAVVTFMFFFISFLIYIPFVLYFGFPNDFSFLKFAALAGLIYAVGFTFYSQSLKIEEVSLVTPLYNFNVVFLLILAVVLLGETFDFYKLGGILLLFFGASFLMSGKGLIDSYKKLLANKGAMYMLICSMCIAFARIIDGFVVQSVNPVVYGLFLQLFLSAYLIIYILLRRQSGDIKKMIVNNTKLTLGLGFINGFSYLFLLVAFTAVEVSVAEPLTMFGAITTIILGKILFKEKIKGRLTGALVMIAGAWFLFV